MSGQFFHYIEFTDKLADEYRQRDSEGLTAEAAAMWSALKWACEHFDVPKERYDDCFVDNGQRPA